MLARRAQSIRLPCALSWALNTPWKIPMDCIDHVRLVMDGRSLCLTEPSKILDIDDWHLVTDAD